MNAVQLPLTVEALLIIAAATLGILLGKKGRPYGKIKLGFHLFFFLWFSTGYFFIVKTLVNSPWSAVSGLVLVMGLALATLLAVGLTLLLKPSPHRILPKIHGTAALILFLTDMAAWVTSGMNP